VLYIFAVDAVRLNPATKRARNNEIESVIKDWLRTASSRTGETGLSGSGSVTLTSDPVKQRDDGVCDSDSSDSTELNDIESD
jgi:hypothetical protein